MRREKWAFLLFFLIIGNITLFITPDVKGNVKLEPAELIISMPEGYPKEDIQYKIRVTNRYSFNITASTRIVHPFNGDFIEGYTRIPDLSWVKIEPEILFIPAKESRDFLLHITIPESKKQLHYNESWEIWVIVLPKTSKKGSSSNTTTVSFQMQLASRVLINTPPGEKKLELPQNFYLILLGSIIGFAMLAVVYFYVNKRRRILDRRAAMFYVKSRRSGRHRKY